MAQSLVSRVVNSNCHTRNLTIRHLTRKLKRLNQRIERPDALTHHYLQRNRVEQRSQCLSLLMTIKRLPRINEAAFLNSEINWLTESGAHLLNTFLD